MVQAVRLQELKRKEEEASRAAAAQAVSAASAPPPPAAASAVAANSRAAVLEGLDDDEDSDNEGGGGGENAEIDACLEDDQDPREQSQITAGQHSRSQALRAQEDVPPVSPLCIRIQVHAEGITEALLFHVDLLASAIRQAVIIKVTVPDCC